MAMMENEMEKKVYKVEDVQNLLGLGRSKAYEFPSKKTTLFSFDIVSCCVSFCFIRLSLFLSPRLHSATYQKNCMGYDKI